MRDLQATAPKNREVPALAPWRPGKSLPISPPVLVLDLPRVRRLIRFGVADQTLRDGVLGIRAGLATLCSSRGAIPGIDVFYGEVARRDVRSSRRTLPDIGPNVRRTRVCLCNSSDERGQGSPAA